MSLEGLIEQADRNLYKHKANKTNTQIIIDAERAAGISQPEQGKLTEYVSTRPPQTEPPDDR
jgi:hypothetical protein